MQGASTDIHFANFLQSALDLGEVADVEGFLFLESSHSFLHPTRNGGIFPTVGTGDEMLPLVLGHQMFDATLTEHHGHSPALWVC